MGQRFVLSANVDFMIHGLFKYSFFGHEVWITTTHVSILFIMLILVGFALVANIKLKKAGEVPEGFANAVELVVEKLDGMVDSAMGVHARRFYNYIGTIFIFILVSNLAGLLGLRPPHGGLWRHPALRRDDLYLNSFQQMETP